MSDTPRTDSLEQRFLYATEARPKEQARALDIMFQEYAELESENRELKERVEELESLFRLQHKRCLIANKLWQAAHNQYDCWPDLGKLIGWLLKLSQGCFSCDYGPMCSKDALRCSGCRFAMKNPVDGNNNWSPKKAERISDEG